MSVLWHKQRELSGVINDDDIIPKKLRVKLHETIIWPVLLYGAEVWTLGHRDENILKTTGKSLRRIRSVTLRVRDRSVNIRRELGVSKMNEKVKTIKMRWYGQVSRRENGHPARIPLPFYPHSISLIFYCLNSLFIMRPSISVFSLFLSILAKHALLASFPP